ncbi:MAG: allophanate hydrolase subunit 1 [Actinomycetota bacterium]|nr:allophanate hydrolase subunit 1 [Actinomycetota bacterium]
MPHPSPRSLPSGERAVLIELDDLADVQAHYAALIADPPPDVVEMVPAARTILLVARSPECLPALRERISRLRPSQHPAQQRPPVTVPVSYDGADLHEVAGLLGYSPEALVRRHKDEVWTVAFSGFAPGFGYLTAASGTWQVPRRRTPRTAVPAGSVALAGEFSGVYPRATPGGWQLIGRTALSVFDLLRDPPALLAPGTRVHFEDVGDR